jgi:hypothetical protein
VLAAVTRLGRRWIPQHAVKRGSMVDLTGGEVLRIAMDEHIRWHGRRQRAPFAGEEQDGSRRVNSNMRPWPDLPEEARGRACREISSQLQELEAFGFLPVLPDGGPPRATRFQRFGEVRAEPLAASTTWQSPTGDTFAASAGDWLVVDEFGHKRTVRHEEFHASHAPLGGDRWRRTGTVLAGR